MTHSKRYKSVPSLFGSIPLGMEVLSQCNLLHYPCVIINHYSKTQAPLLPTRKESADRHDAVWTVKGTRITQDTPSTLMGNPVPYLIRGLGGGGM